jgi:hypothetical protein
VLDELLATGLGCSFAFINLSCRFVLLFVLFRLLEEWLLISDA